jgi:hypothetical protein
MKFKTIFLLVVVLCLMTAVTLLALPESPTSLSITWWSTDGGGGTSKGSTFSLSGTAGQADAGRMTGGSYSLTGGFWNEQTGGIGGGPTLKVYLPFVRK